METHSGSSRKKSGASASGIDGSTIVGSSHAVGGKVVSGHLRRDSDRVMASESLNSVMGEELQLKIAENARLHAALDGVDKRYFGSVLNKTFWTRPLPKKKALPRKLPVLKCLECTYAFSSQL